MPRAKKGSTAQTAMKENAPGFIEFYANNLQIERSPWDFRLRLGLIYRTDDAKLAIKEYAHVMMAPSHLKTVVGVLANQITQYEKEYGLIPQPGITITKTADGEKMVASAKKS